MRQLVNTALRRGLAGSAPRRPKTVYSCPTSSMGQPQVNLDKALPLAAALEDVEVLRELDPQFVNAFRSEPYCVGRDR